MRAASLRLFPPKSPSRLAVTAVVAIFLFLDCVLLSLFDLGDDWAPLWVAGGIAWGDPLRAYDFAHVTSLHWQLLGPTGERPFIYPPTTLMLLAPLGLIPFHFSFAAFVAASLFFLARVSSKLGVKPMLVLIAPPVALAAIAGQPTLLVAALVVSALLFLPSSERKAGLLLGIAAVIKPPLLLLVPFAMVGGKHWRALEAAGVTVAAFVAASVLLFGIEAWQAWFAALPEFQALIVAAEPLLRNTVTPYATVLRLGYDAQWTTIGFVAVAIPLVMIAFAQTRDVPLRLVMLVGGALLISPYAMYYELAALAPAVAAMPLRRAQDAVMPVIWALSLFVNASVVGLLAVYCWAAARLFFAGPGDRPVKHGVDVAA